MRISHRAIRGPIVAARPPNPGMRCFGHQEVADTVWNSATGYADRSSVRPPLSTAPLRNVQRSHRSGERRHGPGESNAGANQDRGRQPDVIAKEASDE